MKDLLRFSTNIQRLLTLLIFLCWAGLTSRAMAQSDVYVRVSLHEQPAEGIYAISGFDDKDNGKGREVFLSSEKVTSDRMKAEKLDVDAGSRQVTIQDAKFLWKLTYDAQGRVRLYSPAKKMYLARKENGERGLKLVSSADNRCLWRFELLPSGALYLYDATNSERMLCAYWDATKSVFNNYSAASNPRAKEGLTLYRSMSYAPSSVNRLPQEGQTLCLGSADEVRAKGGAPLTLTDYLLSDGSLAPTDEMALWKAEEVDLSAQSFLLHGREGYLSYALVETAERAKWMLKDGAICTLEEQPRYLCYMRDGWKVLPKDEASSLARMYMVAENPEFEMRADGVGRLSGGWTASALSEIKWDEMLCLDLTQIRLPQKHFDFKNQALRNAPIFVAETEKQFVQSGWRFVVVCGADGNQLLDARLQLTDKMPFYTDRAFHVEQGQVVYQREQIQPDRWQTVSLPFDAKIVKGRACALTATDFSFSAVDVLSRGEGYIALGDSVTHLLVVESQAGEVQAVEAEKPLKGTFLSKQISANQGPIYLLHPVKQQFVRAGEGSMLSPFRAYLQTEAQRAESIRLLRMPR